MLGFLVLRNQVAVIPIGIGKRTENPCVAGSIPAHTTSFKKPQQQCWGFLQKTFVVLSDYIPK